MANETEGEGEPATHRAYRSSTDRAVSIELLDSDGNVLSERSLAKSGTCDDVALAVAVVLATWEAKLNPQLTRSTAPLPAMPASVREPIVAKHVEPAAGAPRLRVDAGLAGNGAGGEARATGEHPCARGANNSATASRRCLA